LDLIEHKEKLDLDEMERKVIAADVVEDYKKAKLKRVEKVAALLS